MLQFSPNNYVIFVFRCFNKFHIYIYIYVLSFEGNNMIMKENECFKGKKLALLKYKFTAFYK
jgi:hypothetical protein